MDRVGSVTSVDGRVEGSFRDQAAAMGRRSRALSNAAWLTHKHQRGDPAAHVLWRCLSNRVVVIVSPLSAVKSLTDTWRRGAELIGGSDCRMSSRVRIGPMPWHGTVTWDVYVVTDAGLARGRSHQAVIEAAIAGGATIVQYREKAASTRQMVTEAQALLELARRFGVPLIVNDRIDVALAVDADGVHVGQDDMPARLARQLIGSHKILGVSVSTLAEAKQAVEDGADYLGVGPVFATPTKPDAAPPIGMDGLRSICQQVSIPTVAIGGINAVNAAAAIAAGATGVAVVSAVVAADDVAAAARQLREIVTGARSRAF